MARMWSAMRVSIWPRLSSTSLISADLKVSKSVLYLLRSSLKGVQSNG